MSNISYYTGIQLKLFYSYVFIVSRVRLLFSAFPSVKRYIRFWMVPVIDLEYFAPEVIQRVQIWWI